MTSSIDFSHYNAPGVYTEAVPGPQIGVYSVTPLSVGMFGQTRGYRVAVESITIPADDSQSHPVESQPLSQQGIDKNSLVVRDPVTGSAYTLTTDYTVTSHPGVSGVTNGPDATLGITRVSSGAIPVSKVVQIAYNYTDPTYFDAKQFFSYNDLVDAYGPALDTQGNILSELTFAAGFAFMNGAQRIVAAACTNPGNVTVQDYQNALDQLKQDPSIAVIVPASGQQPLHSIVRTHVDLQSNERLERRAMVGRDGTVTAVSSATRIANAQSIFDERVLMVSPATAYYYNPLINQVQLVGSQFVAAALAGVAVSVNPAKPLTRMPLNGFVGVPESMSDTQRNVETQGGLCVIEQTHQGSMRVRHGTTTNPSNLLTREWSILGQQDAMVVSLRQYLDADGIIGSIIDDLTLSNVRATTSASLDAMQTSGTIIGYRNLAARQLLSNPDVIEVSFEWSPAIPLNYIVVRFSINISTGSISSTGAVTRT